MTFRPLAWSALFALSVPSLAAAHVCMEAPVSRVGPSCGFTSPQKEGPCGVAGRSQYVTTFRPGETITVRLNETINHPSHYRIAFNPNGDNFEDPTSKDDKSGGHPFVLLDGIVDEDANVQNVQVTLPNVTCTACTLQLIQVMYDKGGNGFGGNNGAAPGADNDDLYYACADLVLAGEPVAGGGDAGSAPADASTPVTTTDAGSTTVLPTTPGTPAPPTIVDAGDHDHGLDASAPPVAPGVDGGANPATPPTSSAEDGCALGGKGRGDTLAGVLVALGALALVRRRRTTGRP